MNRTTTTDEYSIRRIVAVLLALADLAECASGRSLAVRSLVLWLLRSGEVLARDYVAGLTRHATGQGELPRVTGNSATEAIRLAQNFRNLAAALTALAAEVVASPRQAVAALCGGFPSPLLAATDPLAARRNPTMTVGRLDSS